MWNDRSVRALTRAEIADLVPGDRVILQYWARGFCSGNSDVRSHMVVRDLIEASVSHRTLTRLEATPLKDGAYRSHIRVFSLRTGKEINLQKGICNYGSRWELAVHCDETLDLVREFRKEAMKQIEISRILDATSSREKLDKLRYEDLLVASRALEGQSRDSEVVK